MLRADKQSCNEFLLKKSIQQKGMESLKISNLTFPVCLLQSISFYTIMVIRPKYMNRLIFCCKDLRKYTDVMNLEVARGYS